MKILVINGPNMSVLDRREGYGNVSMEQLKNKLLQYAKKRDVLLEFFESDIEGQIVNKINTSDSNAIIINPAAYSHYSIAILDALQIFRGKKVEVHITNLAKRELERQKTLTAKACDGVISGFGVFGYILAVKYILDGDA